MSVGLLFHQIAGRNGENELMADSLASIPCPSIHSLPPRFAFSSFPGHAARPPADRRSGHEVPAYTHGSLAVGQAAFQMFSQIMSNNSLSSTDASGTTTTTSGSSGTTSGAAASDTSKPNSSPLDAASSLWSVLVSGLVAFVVLPF